MFKKITVPLYLSYTQEVLPKLREEFDVNNNLALPELEKVIVNMGIRQAKDDKSIMEEALSELSQITGQKPKMTKAKRSVSNFSLRQGMAIGCMVTLRGKMMYSFLDKLLRVVIPRIRDFSGIKRSFDRFGNLTIGIKDETIFPEISADKLKSSKGLSITIVTSRHEKEQSIRMFELLGFPFVDVA